MSEVELDGLDLVRTADDEHGDSGAAVVDAQELVDSGRGLTASRRVHDDEGAIGVGLPVRPVSTREITHE